MGKLLYFNGKRYKEHGFGIGKSYSSQGRLHFGVCRTKYLQTLVHWVQDFYRVSKVPIIVGLSQTLFRANLERALAREEIRKSLRELTKTATDEASPGPLEKEKTVEIVGRKIY